MLEELRALPSADVGPVTADVLSATLVVLGAAPRVRRMRAELVAVFGERALRPLDRAERVAHAALGAHLDHLLYESEPTLAELAERLTARLHVLLSEVRDLVQRGLVPADALAGLTRKAGYRNVGMDVLLLVSVLREHWDTALSETGVTLAQLDAAEAAVDELTAEAGRRARSARSSAADLRRRAFHLLETTWDDVRRLVGFLRWKQGDADRIAPPLHLQPRARARAASPTDPATEHDR